MSKIRIMHGDNIELLKTLADNSIDSAVIDAPYGLGKEPDASKMIQAWVTVGHLEVKGKGFMGKKWDAFVPQPNFWKEVFRVLKPGAHVCCFFGTRTYDWGTLAMRLAGFEIRDMICWHYGSGFPKSLDVSKAIDKMAGEASYHTNEYEGYGTALKPATEPICLARKPLSGTVAQNILQHGTGGLNLDGCRIEFISDKDKEGAVFGRGTNIIGGNYVGATHSTGDTNIQPNDLGRFPANVILDKYMAAEMDFQSGVLSSGGGRKGENGKRNYFKSAGSHSLSGARSDSGEKFWDEEKKDWYTIGKVWNDAGGASRFFYCAKASTSERNAGLEKFESVLTDDGRLKSIVNAFQRGQTERRNFHPTVKPISLMRWLLRLVTPKGGVCLDPFAGSGTAGCAAAFEDCSIILMEMEDEYIPIIEARTKYWEKKANRERYEQELLSSVQTLF